MKPRACEKSMTVLARWLMCLVGLVVVAADASAQRNFETDPNAPPQRYKPFPITPDFESMLNNRLQREKQLAPFKDLIKQIVADPEKFPLDADRLKSLKLDDPQFKRAVLDWIDDNPSLRDALRDWVKQHPPGGQTPPVQQLQKKLQSILDNPPGKTPSRPAWAKSP